MHDSSEFLFIDQGLTPSQTPTKAKNYFYTKNVPKISLCIPDQSPQFQTRHSVSFEIPKLKLEDLSNKLTYHSDDRETSHRRFSELGDSPNNGGHFRSMKPVHLVKQEAICESQAASKESLRFFKSISNSPNFSSSHFEYRGKKSSTSGIDAISLDYMRANGNLRGFRQLRNARELIEQKKAASFSNENSLFPTSAYKKVNTSLPNDNSSNNNDECIFFYIDQTNIKVPLHETPRSPQASSATLARRNKLTRNKSMKSVGFKLGKRRSLLEQRKKVADFSCGFALFGIFVMIIELEMSDNMKLYDKVNIYSYLLKSLIGVSTLILIALIAIFHYIEMKILSLDDSIEDWRIIISSRRIIQTLIEVSICSIHPIPGKIIFNWSIYIVGKSKASHQDVSIDVILGICMFARLYLVYRTMLLHSRLLTDVGSRSIGAMNKVNFNMSFLMKTLMTQHPGRTLFAFITSFLLISSWILHTCENAYDSFHADMFNSIWLICITFLSIGYGDVFPHTICGRVVAVSNGLMGCACTALVVAVFAKRLELTKAERHVIEFMKDNELTKKLKFYASNVIRETWLLYKYTKTTEDLHLMKVWKHQRKFLRAIYGLRKIKAKQRKLEDEANQMCYVIQAQHRSQLLLTQFCQDQLSIKSSINILEEKINNLQHQMTDMPDSIAQRISRILEKH